MLIASLPDDVIQWGDRATDVSTTVTGGYHVTFANGRSVDADILIGADGAWSRVRPLLSDIEPAYLGLSFIEARMTGTSSKFPAQTDIVDKGMMFALSDGKGILSHREPHDELCSYAAFRAPAEPNGEWVLDDVLKLFSDWDPALVDLIAKSDYPLIRRSIFALPIGFRWAHKPGVTLIGDAAHLMSPFAGEGANLAMMDGADLAHAIIANPNDIGAAFTLYEAAMFPRSEFAAAQSAAGLETCFNDLAPQPLVNFFLGMAEPGALQPVQTMPGLQS
jgi:2-polyprenyl-6-methoxyphenol hydroxylase-like FAD-dependent oxidoreductase